MCLLHSTIIVAGKVGDIVAKIDDFGEKIGGARKDTWKTTGLKLSDLAEMNSVERQSYVKKDNVWPRPDWIKVIEDGTAQTVAFWQNEMRKSLPPRPDNNNEETVENYVKVVTQVKDAVMAVKDYSEIDSFYDDFINPNYIESRAYGRYVNIAPFAKGIITDKVLKASQSNWRRIRDKAQKTMFGIPEDKRIYTKIKNDLKIFQYDSDTRLDEIDNRLSVSVKSDYSRYYYYLQKDNPFSNKEKWEFGLYFIIDTDKRAPVAINLASVEDAEEIVEKMANEAQQKYNERDNSTEEKDNKSKRKGAFIPPQLRHIDRKGPEYRNESATGQLYMDDLKFRAGEFGNWMGESDRQVSLDMGYDALRDLARVLKISPEDISLGGKLAIAFGARGKGGASAGAAHYEPERQVINLTKMSGAGCLAHEWGHALDHAIGLSVGSAQLASDIKRKHIIPDSFNEVLKTLRYKESYEVEDIRKEKLEKVESAIQSLKNWSNSVRPPFMNEKLTKRWDFMVQELIDNVDKLSGMEYQNFYGRQVTTSPYIEALSLMRKEITNHVIPKDTKIQLALWSREIRRYQEQAENIKPEMRLIETDYYKGSKAFDKAFSKMKHGYWQSECEMFARAFDCYVSDKLEEAGLKSEYLTAYADSYRMKDENGEIISAVPLGDERTAINKQIDLLIDDLKERGLLHHFIEEEKDAPKIEEQLISDFDWNVNSTKRRTKKKDDNYKQLSFADLISDAANRAGEASRGRTAAPSRDFHRE